MRANILKAIQHTARAAITAILLASGVPLADTVNLTAAPTQAALPDGQIVPMWGYGCGAVVSGSTATCMASNPNAGGN